MKTRITERLGIRYPIVEGGMQWVGRAELAAAISNAGALGMVTARTQPTPEHLLAEIGKTRTLTDKPFGVNLTLSFKGNQDMDYGQWIDAIAEGGVKIVETAGNRPDGVIDQLKAYGITVIHKCTSVRHALSAERAGVDIISIDGFEAAGHPGENDTSALVIIPAVRRQLQVPILASGGIADGRGMAAALALGADGVNMGTRFMLTRECAIHPNIKKALLAACELDTTLIQRAIKRTGRYFTNAVSTEIAALEGRVGGARYEDTKHLLSGARGKAGLESGEVHYGLICASQVIGMIDDIPGCEELVQRMVADCRQHLQETLKLFDAH
ncbi:NAD(P)H-dependent flavin oxidoreductase [Pseudomonas sp. NPDC090755]|uniref:NAD(P)H-dependent flavin oxidoreductase n=1 Tax=Pseudomonas sp. NPDC090755 TaxID=3364481 RepID=UPI00383B7CB7